MMLIVGETVTHRRKQNITNITWGEQEREIDSLAWSDKIIMI